MTENCPSYTSAKARFQLSSRIALAGALVRNKAERDDDPILEAADLEWDAALEEQMAAWKALAESPVSGLAELADKISTCRAEPSLSKDGECLAVLAAAVERDVLALRSPIDSEIIVAFDQWRDGLRQLLAAPLDDPCLPGEIESEEEKRCWTIISPAWGTILEARAATPRGLAIKLALALHNMDGHVPIEQGLARDGLAGVPNCSPDADWTLKMVHSVFRSLLTMEPVA